MIANATAVKEEVSLGACIDIYNPELAWEATILWCLVVSIVTIALVRRIAEPTTWIQRIGRTVALILCVTTLIVVSEDAEREIATRLVLLTNPGASVGFFNDFPSWPSALVAVVSVGLSLIEIRSRIKGQQPSSPVSSNEVLGPASLYLFLAGILLPILTDSFSPGMAVALWSSCQITAVILGVVGWRQKTAKVAVILAAAAILLPLLVYMVFVFGWNASEV